MNDSTVRMERRWVRLAAGFGLVSCIVYPLMIYIHFPLMIQIVLGATFGPSLMVACVGLYHLLKLHEDSVSIQIATISNILAGAMVTAMIIVQLAVREGRDMYLATPGADEYMRLVVTRIWDVILGLDVAFDVFIGLGTLLFGIGMLNHPRFGRFIGIVGIIVGGVVILGFNFATFPAPPKEAGLIDPGPVTGLWYLWVVILAFRSFRWVDEKLETG